VIAPVLGLVVRPSVGRLRLLDDLFGMKTVSHQRHYCQKCGDDRHRDAYHPLSGASRLLAHLFQFLCFHGQKLIIHSVSLMDLRQLEILQAIAETGSFTACGRKLHVSQSAISRQVLLLEEELGEPLFLRVGRQVRMTQAAETLVQLGQRVFQDVRETVGAITDRTRELRGTLRLSGGMTVCLYVFPPLLKHLRRVHPRLDVRLIVATAGRSVQEIRAGHVDAGLLTLPVEESDLVTVPVLREELLLVTMPTHPLAKQRRVAPADLAGQPFVMFESGSATRRVIDRFFVGENIEPMVVMDTENVEIIKAMVKTGLGISIVPYQAVAREVRAGQFFCARIEGHELVRETGWVYAKANRPPRVIRELLAAFGEVRGRLRLSPRRARARNS
jgi:DNA-binding transcriptional LysR family regulator